MIPLLHSKSVLSLRRRKISETLEIDREILVLFTAPDKTRNADTTFPHRPDSDFLYLTGFAEPGAVLFMAREKPSKGKKAVLHEALFVLPRDPLKEQWDGFRYGPEGASKLTGIQECGDSSQWEEALLQWLNHRPQGCAPRVLSNAHLHDELQTRLNRVLEKFAPRGRKGQMDLEGVLDGAARIRAQRLIKDSADLTKLRESSNINVQAHLKLMHELRPGMKEYQVRALLESEYFRLGAEDVAYGTIAAAGANATILHYRASTAVCKKGDLLLVDAGCEKSFFASDITRTLPVGGKYSREQRNIMDVVFEAHQAALAEVRPGVPYTRIHQTASKVLEEGLRTLKLLPKKVPLTQFYPHGTGHWLGHDVHDPCPYVDSQGDSLKLQPGMVFTIEPGLYFMEHDKKALPRYRGIGVRIEDDIVVTEDGYSILTEGLPRSASEIESEMSRS
jgi:Xaa-Pro aminopeptidase